MAPIVRTRNRWPPRWAAILVYLTLPGESRRQDYLSVVEAYRQRVSPSGKTRRAQRWMAWQAIDGAWRVVPDYVKQAAFAVLVKWILRV